MLLLRFWLTEIFGLHKHAFVGLLFFWGFALFIVDFGILGFGELFLILLLWLGLIAYGFLILTFGFDVVLML